MHRLSFVMQAARVAAVCRLLYQPSRFSKAEFNAAQLAATGIQMEVDLLDSKSKPAKVSLVTRVALDVAFQMTRDLDQQGP